MEDGSWLDREDKTSLEINTFATFVGQNEGRFSVGNTILYALPWFGMKLGLMKPFSNEDVGVKSDSLFHLISSSFSI